MKVSLMLVTAALTAICGNAAAAERVQDDEQFAAAMSTYACNDKVRLIGKFAEAREAGIPSSLIVEQLPSPSADRSYENALAHAIAADVYKHGELKLMPLYHYWMKVCTFETMHKNKVALRSDIHPMLLACQESFDSRRPELKVCVERAFQSLLKAG